MPKMKCGYCRGRGDNHNLTSNMRLPQKSQVWAQKAARLRGREEKKGPAGWFACRLEMLIFLKHSACASTTITLISTTVTTDPGDPETRTGSFVLMSPTLRAPNLLISPRINSPSLPQPLLSFRSKKIPGTRTFKTYRKRSCSFQHQCRMCSEVMTSLMFLQQEIQTL